MSKNETLKNQPVPVVTERTRKPREGFKNPNKGIHVAEGLNMQDVPREMIMRHLKENEQLAKARFQQKYGHQFGGQQSF
jgi:coproporphyrinogen III oxidase-like Fe-S oxidoreductase